VISRRFSLWQKTLALAPVLLLLAYVPGEMMLRCRMDGLLRPTCCCPEKAQAESETASPVIQAQDCCAREVAQNSRPAAATARPADRELFQMTAVALATPVAPVMLSPDDRSDRAWQRYGPAREGPPLVLLKHAFLI
jgi:hypothetical protein